MAKVIEHGKYWKEELQKACPDVQVKCPECNNTICISYYYYYLETASDTQVWCECGCKFIPESSDIVVED